MRKGVGTRVFQEMIQDCIAHNAVLAYAFATTEYGRRFIAKQGFDKVDVPWSDRLVMKFISQNDH